MKSVYFALLHSHISFGIALYGSTTIDNLTRILILQKKALRIMLNLKWYDSTKQYFSELGIFTVFSLYIYEIILIIKASSSSMLSLGQSHKYYTRNQNKFAYKSHNLKLFERKPRYAGIKYYNKLPLEIRSIDNYNKFKSKLKVYLLSKPLYSLLEYFELE